MSIVSTFDAANAALTQTDYAHANIAERARTDWRDEPPDDPQEAFRDAAITLFDAAESLVTFFRAIDVNAPDWEKAEAVLYRLKADAESFGRLLDTEEEADAGVPIAAQQAEYEALVDITEEVQE